MMERTAKMLPVYLGVVVLAACVTYGIILSGLDWGWNWYVHVYVNATVGDMFDVLGFADMLGFIAAPLFAVFCGIRYLMLKHIVSSKKDVYKKMCITAVCVMLVGLTVSTAIKAVAGRESPPHFHTASGLLKMETWVDNSTNFQFGFMREQVFGGYPSSHATIYVGLLSALYYGLRRQEVGATKKEKGESTGVGINAWHAKSILIVSSVFALALFISLGVSLGHHWLSEVVAGAMLGWVVGKAVEESVVK